MHDSNIGTKGVCKEDPNLVVYIFDEDWNSQQLANICSCTRNYEAAADTREFGLEFYIFHDLYMSEYERTQLFHFDEKSNSSQEARLQARLTEEDKVLAQALASIRQGTFDWQQVGHVPQFNEKNASVFETTVAIPFQSPKYHRIRA
jgi:hypothetical protein